MISAVNYLNHLSPIFWVVTAISSCIVVWSKLGAIASPTLQSFSTVVVVVAVALSSSARFVWSAAVSTEAFDHRTTRTILVRTSTVVTRRRTVLKTSTSCLSILSSDSGCAPSRPVHRLVGGAVVEDPAVPLEGELAPLPLQTVALWAVHTVVLASLVGPVSIG